MKLKDPEYYQEFKRIANKCKDTCCKGWEIDIDNKTFEYYLNVKGDFSKKIKCNISQDEPHHFIFNKDGKCPFLNNSNLCDIFVNLGEEHLCQICALHPRYFEWFKDLKESGIGLCCEEAARIILSQNKPFKTYEIDIPFEDCDNYDENIFSILEALREDIIKYLSNNSIPLNIRIYNILKNTKIIQNNIDIKSFSYDFEFIDFKCDNIKNDLKPLLNFFLKLEYLDRDFKKSLENGISHYDILNQNSEQVKDFTKANPEVNTYLENIAIYFVWRYFLKGVFDYDIWSKINLMVVSLIIIKFLFICKWLENDTLSFDDCIIIAKKYSQEIEYSDDNLKILAQASYDNYFFSSNYLSGLLL